MKRWIVRTLRVRAAVSLSLIVVALAACTAEPEAVPASALQSAEMVSVASADEERTSPAIEQVPPSVTPESTEPAVSIDAPQSTREAPPTATPVPTTAPSLTPSPTITPTTAPTETPVPSPTTEPGRYCPETPPLKPEYNRFYLSAKKWPQPDDEIAQNHFWMSEPLAGADRVLINQQFPYGWDQNGRLLLHTGADIAEDLGTPLLAVADGTVVVAQSDYSAWYGWRCDWYGHLVVIELDERWQDQPIYALYGHILNIMVEPGERVVRGQPVAEIGVGGAATHPHLHFEVRVGENEFANTRNPVLWLDPGPNRGVIAGRLIDPEERPWQGVPLALVNDESGEILPSWSYLGDPQSLMNPDEGWAENFVFSDVPPGSHTVVTKIQGVDYQVPVTVVAGEVVAVEIVTESYKEPTPESEEVTPTAESSS